MKCHGTSSFNAFSCCPGLPYSTTIRTPNAMVGLICSSPSPSCVLPNAPMALVLVQGLPVGFSCRACSFPSHPALLEAQVACNQRGGCVRQHNVSVLRSQKHTSVLYALWHRVSLKMHLLVLPLSLYVATSTAITACVSVSSPPLPSLSHAASYPLLEAPLKSCSYPYIL